MYEESNLAALPKYFKNLHLEIAAITGSPRITSIKEGKNCSDKYINIPQEEWESAILNWAAHLEHGYVQVLKDYTFAICGKATNKRHFISGLRKLADELEEIIKE